MEYALKSAEISDCGQYRWELRRVWDTSRWVRCLTFVMCNPSTADGEEDDPTIRRCVNFARDRGFTGMRVLNLFGYRATSPKALREAEDPVGAENDEYFNGLGVGSSVCLAWGNPGEEVQGFEGRPLEIVRLLLSRGVEPFCLGQTKKGAPMHPLYRPRDTDFVPYRFYDKPGSPTTIAREREWLARRLVEADQTIRHRSTEVR